MRDCSSAPHDVCQSETLLIRLGVLCRPERHPVHQPGRLRSWNKLPFGISRVGNELKPT